MIELIKRIAPKTVAGLLVCALSCSVVLAQAVSTAQISGALKDQSGAVLPGVEVAVTQTATGARRTVVTDETGSYILTNMSIGPSMLEASLSCGLHAGRQLHDQRDYLYPVFLHIQH